MLKHILWSTVSSSHLVSKFMIRRLLLNGTYQTLKMFITCRVWFELQSFYNLQCRKLQLPKKWQMSCTYRKLSRILNPQQNSRKPPESPTRTVTHKWCHGSVPSRVHVNPRIIQDPIRN